MVRAQLLSLAAVLLLGAAPSRAMPNGIGQTPAMAWSSWNYFAFCINEVIALEIGDATRTARSSLAARSTRTVCAGSLTSCTQRA